MRKSTYNFSIGVKNYIIGGVLDKSLKGEK